MLDADSIALKGRGEKDDKHVTTYFAVTNNFTVTAAVLLPLLLLNSVTDYLTVTNCYTVTAAVAEDVRCC